MWPRLKNIQQEAGQSMVEFAAVGLILLNVTFGFMETGRLVYTASVVQAAAQEGARAAIVDEDVINGVIDRDNTLGLQAIVAPAVQSKLVALDPDQMTVDLAQLTAVTMPASPAAITRDSVTVQITYNYQFMIPFIGRLFGPDETVTLRGQANMLVR